MFCVPKKLRLFSESETNKLVKFGGESVAEFWDGRQWQLQVISKEAKGENLQMCHESLIM